jgi:hypothetical protein
MDRNMNVPDQNRNPLNAVEATTAIDNIVDLDPPGVEYRAIEEMMPPLREEMPPLSQSPGPREEMPPEWGLIQEAMPPEPLPDHVYRILTAVDPKIVSPVLDWRKLLRGIENSVEFYQNAIEARRKKDRIDELDWLKQLRATAQRLQGLLKPENIISFRAYKSELVSQSTLDPKYHSLWSESEFDDYPPEDDPHCSDEGLEDLIGRCRKELEDLEQGKWMNPDEASPERKALYQLHSPFEWLVGVLLPRTFKSHFGYDPPFTSNGAYARFAEAVLREFGITKSNGKAYKRAYIVRTKTASKEAAFPRDAKVKHPRATSRRK